MSRNGSRQCARVVRSSGLLGATPGIVPRCWPWPSATRRRSPSSRRTCSPPPREATLHEPEDRCSPQSAATSGAACERGRNHPLSQRVVEPESRRSPPSTVGRNRPFQRAPESGNLGTPAGPKRRTWPGQRTTDAVRSLCSALSSDVALSNPEHRDAQRPLVRRSMSGRCQHRDTRSRP